MSYSEIYHIEEGISQSERYVVSLRPDYFKIEEREKEDILKFIIEISKHFNFYNLNNEIDGNWQDFLIADVDIILQVISKFSINSYIKQYDKLKNELLYAQDDKTGIQNLSAIMLFLDSFLVFQETLHNKFRLTRKNDPEIFEFRKFVKEYDFFDDELGVLKKYMFQVNLYFWEDFTVPNNRKLNEVELKEFYSNPENALDNTQAKVLIDKLLPKLDKIFYSLRSKYNRLLEAAEIYLHKQKFKGDTFEPHIGLLLTFLDLYQYLKKDINNFTKKHLDLYYNRILELNFKKALPDTVNLLFELKPNTNSFNLEKGEVLLAKNPISGEVVNFQTDHDLLITRATIKQLNTLFVSNHIKIPAKDDMYLDVKEMQVFVSSNPVYLPGDFLIENNDKITWPLLGEDQLELSVEERSMEFAEMGLLIASPLLYAKDGRRKFTIKFYISQKSANLFVEHVNNYAHVSGINQKVLIFEMLSKAFDVHITGEEGWVHVKKYTAFFNPEQETDNFIEFDFELIHTDPPTDIYRTDIHGYDYQTEWPIIRFLINNNSFHNPYTFLKDIFLQRIAIKLSVTDSEQFTLQNNIGEIGKTNPFQLFGPQASVGSYVDVQNANIFNCYTRNFTIKLNWFDLPRDKGGFQTYYQSYNPVVKNDSFKVSISGLNEGRFQPALDDQQSFQLFTMADEPGKKDVLSKLSILKNIDFSKIHFNNAPSYSLESANSETDFKAGAVRLELIAPEEGFGNKIFPTLFSEIIINNAKRFRKKIPVPNPPYLAVVRKLTIDYVLEHSEVISGINKESERLQNLFIWHHDPLGYKRVYPKIEENEIGLISQIKNQSNLLIGLENVPENQVLTIFFQIEETNFQNSGYNTEPVNWHMLQNNRWQLFNRADILFDDTLHFIKSGIVKLFIPELSDKKNTIMNPAYLWIRASSNNRNDIRTRIKAVFTQCSSATRIIPSQDAPNQPHYLAPGSIQEFQRKVPQVQNVWQPFSSFGGQAKETEDKYYVRVSESLRHKQRLITTTDMAQFVLEKFPNILKVFCYGIGHNNKLVLPGYDVQVIVIPRKFEIDEKELKEPNVSLADLYKIRKFVEENISPFIKIDVSNPVYERVKIVCSVMFNKSYSKSSLGNNISKLNNDIKKFIAPWMYSVDSDIKMEGRLYLSKILNFIKNLPYISHVTSFSVLHFYRNYNAITGKYDSHIIDTAIDSISYLKGSTPGVILVSAPNHDITVLDDKIYEKPVKTGIGGLVISEEYIVDITHESKHDADKADNKISGEDEFDFFFNPKN